MLKKITTIRALFRQVLIAPSRKIAFDRYFTLVNTFGPLQIETLAGGDRYETEWRAQMHVTPQDKTGQHLFVAMEMAKDAGLNLSQLSDLFEEANPKTPHDILCVIEDAICIINHFGE